MTPHPPPLRGSALSPRERGATAWKVRFPGAEIWGPVEANFSSDHKKQPPDDAICDSTAPLPWGESQTCGAEGGGPLGPEGEGFFWAVGIENTVNPALGWDQYAWTAHRDLWREDFRLAAELGVTHIRYGVPWPDANPAPGVFNWIWADAALAELERLGLEPIWDLLHFGGPEWLEGGLLDADYPQAVTEYARAFAQRYPQVTKITPFNEPYIWSFFTGGNGTWFPHGLDTAGFARSLWPVLQGLRGGIQAIKAVNPNAEIWLNDGADRFTAATPELEPLAQQLTELRYAAFDVLDQGSGVYQALSAIAGNELDNMLSDPTPADVIGLDYYPGSDHLIFPPSAPKHPGDWGQREDYRLYPDPSPPGLAVTLLEYHQRYGVPLYIKSFHPRSGRCAKQRILVETGKKDRSQRVGRGVLLQFVVQHAMNRVFRGV